MVPSTSYLVEHGDGLHIFFFCSSVVIIRCVLIEWLSVVWDVLNLLHVQIASGRTEDSSIYVVHVLLI